MRMHEVERETPACEVIVDTAHHERGAVPLGAGAQLVGAHPQRADDIGIERAVGIGRPGIAAIREAQIGGASRAFPCAAPEGRSKCAI